MVEEENCHPMKSLCLGLLQVPVWICFSSAIRNLVYGLPSPTTNGIFYFLISFQLVVFKNSRCPVY